uniref:PKcGMP_CC domain-containing protein n=1 Tax=Heterorhabditis bacteriophora TaxID=37862 RepID=A0A1I7XC13_HETBA
MSVEELEGYRQQIALIDHQLLVVTDASTRENIVEMRKDLVELTTLLEEQLAGDTSVINDLHSQCSKSSIISDQGLSDLDDFVGMRCYAPFSRAQLPISHHSAIILEVVAPNPIEEKVQVCLIILYLLINMSLIFIL